MNNNNESIKARDSKLGRQISMLGTMATTAQINNLILKSICWRRMKDITFLL